MDVEKASQIQKNNKEIQAVIRTAHWNHRRHWGIGIVNWTFWSWDPNKSLYGEHWGQFGEVYPRAGVQTGAIRKGLP